MSDRKILRRIAGFVTLLILFLPSCSNETMEGKNVRNGLKNKPGSGRKK